MFSIDYLVFMLNLVFLFGDNMILDDILKNLKFKEFFITLIQFKFWGRQPQKCKKANQLGKKY